MPDARRPAEVETRRPRAPRPRGPDQLPDRDTESMLGIREDSAADVMETVRGWVGGRTQLLPRAA